MIELPSDLPPELVPLSWLIGVWEGSGVIDYDVDGEHVTAEFGQRVSFSHDGLPYLNYSSYTWLLDADDVPGGELRSPLVSELGYWSLARPQTAGDPGPGMLPPTAGPSFADAEGVEALRKENGFDLSVSLVHPTGVSELYLGTVNGPRIDLATDYVMRAADTKEYSAATRMYGLVDQHLLWAWDIAALGQDLRNHASARLAKRD